jgi:8-oxo-dGTP diphosphatase
MTSRSPIIVCCAIIEYNGKILLAQRSHKMNNPGKWEFPGGKTESGETNEECIVREIREELNLEIRITVSLQAVTHQYPDKFIKLIPFICVFEGSLPTLNEHQNIAWVNPHEVGNFDCSAADIKVWQQYLEIKMGPENQDPESI